MAKKGKQWYGNTTGIHDDDDDDDDDRDADHVNKYVWIYTCRSLPEISISLGVFLGIG